LRRRLRGPAWSTACGWAARSGRRPAPADQRHGRTVTRRAADLDLRIGGLFTQPVGDDAADRVGGVARRLDAARIGDKDEARAINLHFFQQGRRGAFDTQQRIIDVFIDGDAQHVAGTDGVGPQLRGVLEFFGEAKCGDHGGGAGDTVIDRDDEGIAFLLHRSGKNLSFVRARLWQAAG
jgi:hypothetical protein